MQYKEIIKNIQKKELRPVYFLHGEEAYFIDAITEAIQQNVLSESEKAFNFTIFYGKEVDFKTVVDVARRYPMMAPYQVVIIKEAQEMKSLSDLQTYIEKPSATTVLVICHKHKKMDMRTKFAKAISQYAFVFDAAKLYDNQIPDWIKNYLKEHQFTIQADAADLIAEYLGTDLSKIVNELDKLALNIKKGTTLTPAHVEENIGISKDYNVFELQKALGQRDVLKANRIVQYFAANPRKNPLVVVIGTLYSYFSKIYMLTFILDKTEKEQVSALQLRNEWALKEYKAALRTFNRPKTETIIHLLKEYDLKSKGVGAVDVEEGALLRELVWKILH